MHGVMHQNAWNMTSKKLLFKTSWTAPPTPWVMVWIPSAWHVLDVLMQMLTNMRISSPLQVKWCTLWCTSPGYCLLVTTAKLAGGWKKILWPDLTLVHTISCTITKEEYLWGLLVEGTLKFYSTLKVLESLVFWHKMKRPRPRLVHTFPKTSKDQTRTRKDQDHSLF